MQRSAKLALVAVVVVIVFGAFGFWWFVLRSDNPERASLNTGGGAPVTGTAPATINGTWTVQADPNAEKPSVFVGYRMQELFAGQTIKKEAVGRTGTVSGTMTINGTTVPSAELTADMTKLRSDSGRRDNYIRQNGLELDKFTTATFKLTTPIQLPGSPKQGEKINVSATGELTIHGVTKTVTIPLEAQWNGPSIRVVGSTEIALADYSIEKISIPTVTVDEKGTLEIDLTFVPAKS